MSIAPGSRRGPSLTPPPDALALSVDQVCARLQLSRPSVVHLITSGRLFAIKVGRSWRISATSLDRLLGETAGEVER